MDVNELKHELGEIWDLLGTINKRLKRIEKILEKKWNYDIDNDEGQQIHLCSTLLPVICEHHQTLDDCGSEACAKFGHTWNTWKGEDGCEMMGEQGYSPYDEVEKWKS